MHPVEWLPPEPMSVRKLKEYQSFDHVTASVAVIGVQPTPLEEVVAMFFWIHDTVIWVVFDRDVDVWLELSALEVNESVRRTPRIVDELWDWLDDHYADERLALMAGAAFA